MQILEQNINCYEYALSRRLLLICLLRSTVVIFPMFILY